jgi:type IV secretory pathway TrbD component
LIQRKFSAAGGDLAMPLIQVLLALIVIGVLLWLVNTYIPMQGTIKSILNGVVVIVVVVWLLQVFGVLHNVTNLRVGN